jgi:flagellar biogenesis protein FliO
MSASWHDPTLLAALATGLGVVVLLVTARWRGPRPGRGGERIELVTSRYLGGKKVLTLVEVEGERLLLAVSGSTVRLVARLGNGQRQSGCAGGEPEDAGAPARGAAGREELRA